MSARRVLTLLRRTLVWLALLALAAILAVAVVVPRLGGATPYVISTGSMRPDLPPGTLVVVRPVDDEEIGIGSVITYQVRSGEPAVATHRVIATSIDGRGQRSWRTQGDANDAADPEPVRPVQVKGELWYAVPHVGRIGDLISPQRRLVLAQLLAAGLVGYALVMFAGAGRQRRSARRDERVRLADEQAAHHQDRVPS
ncbi:signal peptidase I [Nocardioides dubius]|uniref:Signal peptidase I n=1 Tax=Nocardioides dubius TaxID=317019 RepID=A0ABN1TLW0_9ACTN